MSGFAVGARVDAKIGGWSQFYPGTVSAANIDGSYHISFDNGEQHDGVTHIRAHGRQLGIDSLEFDMLNPFHQSKIGCAITAHARRARRTRKPREKLTASTLLLHRCRRRVARQKSTCCRTAW